ncbi:response regulator [Neobacillus pocheonensis]|uniref:Response regulator n=1 Tax=Neobacillus pocheonensis TaxID=363869 RepID=A0ABT0W4J6_9BACI|nr:response regulator [Neobacillus pocheonensis]
MYKVVLVDDKMFVRKGLQSLVDWKRCGFEVVGEASNGEDAHSVIEQLKPDLVVTDIRMPVLDGLELIKLVQQKDGNHPKFIIISGYSDFKYAQQAVRYGVHDFILKPIDQADMEETLTVLSKSLTEQKLFTEKNEELVKKRLFDHLIVGKIDEKEADSYLNVLSLENSKEFYYLIFEVNEFPEMINGITGEHMEEVKKKIAEIIRDSCDLKEKVFIHELEQGTYGLLIPSIFLQRFQMQISKFIYWINKQLSRNIKQKITFYVGLAVPKLYLVRSSYENAQDARQYKYTQDDKSIIFYEEIEKNNSITYTELEDTFYHVLIEQIEENLTIAIMETIDKIFHQFYMRKMAQSAVLTSINRCVHSILKIIKNMEGEVSRLKTFQTMLQLQNYNLTLTQLRKLFIEFVLESKEEIIKLRKQTANGEAHKIKQYVELHYQENISLKTIAAKFYMNPVYLGQLFKKTYGIYFKDYLLQVRINEAKKLLRQSELKIYEIAQNVGINNTDYFVTIFGKLEKITPSEYRNKLLETRKV